MVSARKECFCYWSYKYCGLLVEQNLDYSGTGTVWNSIDIQSRDSGFASDKTQ